MAKPNLYELPAVADAPARNWCGGNLGGDNETCVTTRPLASVDAFVVGDSKPEGAGHELRMRGSGSSGRIAAHSVSVKSDGYRRCRWGQSAALPYTCARQSHDGAAELNRPVTDTEDHSTGAS
jgi:hypothetical protein